MVEAAESSETSVHLYLNGDMSRISEEYEVFTKAKIYILGLLSSGRNLLHLTVSESWRPKT